MGDLSCVEKTGAREQPLLLLCFGIDEEELMPLERRAHA
jgi:hypothetical protein